MKYKIKKKNRIEYVNTKVGIEEKGKPKAIRNMYIRMFVYRVSSNDLYSKVLIEKR